MNAKSVFTLILVFLLTLSATRAEERVQIPKVIDNEVVGEWKVVKMGLGKEMKPMPEDRKMGFIFTAEAKGFQIKGERKIAIVWGADEKGNFAAQWVQDGGNGDAVAGKWAISEEGLLLELTEYEDGKGPGEESFTMLCKRVE